MTNLLGKHQAVGAKQALNEPICSPCQILEIPESSRIGEEDLLALPAAVSVEANDSVPVPELGRS